jgi:hypothetical protein
MFCNLGRSQLIECQYFTNTFSYKNGTVQLQKWDGSATKMGRFSYKNGTVRLQKWDGSATKMGWFGYIFYKFVAE